MLWTIKARSEGAYGLSAGRSREALFRAALRTAAGFLKRTGSDPSRVRANARRHLATLADLYPAHLERVEGLSRALGADPLEIVSCSLALASRGVGCTNFAAVPPATKDGKVYVSWNLDLTPFFRLLVGRIPLFVRDVAGSKPYVCMGLPVLFGVGVMNGDGLAACVNSVGSTDGGDGLTFFELNNLAMETQSTAEGAVGVWRDNPRGVLPGLAAAIIMNANDIFADVSGEAVVIEHSHNHMAVEKASGHGGVLASANHHQFLDRNLSGGADPVIEPYMAGSFARLARMWELLDMFKGDIDRNIIRMITTDHGLNYSTLEEFGIKRSPYEERIDDATICCHPWNFFRHLRRLEFTDAMVELNTAKTLNNILMDPMRCTIYVTPGNPCRHQHVPLWLGDALRMEWADRAREEIDYVPGRELKISMGRKGAFRRPQPTRSSEMMRSAILKMFAAAEDLLAASMVRK